MSNNNRVQLEKIIRDDRVWGNPNAEIGFVLIEPADSFKEWQKQTKNWQSYNTLENWKNWDNWNTKKGGNRTWYVASRFVEKIFTDEAKPLHHGCKSFHINLFPLNCKNIQAWPAEYKKMFKSKKDYQNICRSERFPILRKWLQERKNLKVLFCCGKSYWKDFLDFFKLDTKYNKAKEYLMFDIKLDNKPIKLFLVPFLNYRQGIKPIIKDIVQKLKKEK
jgi:hypothetical protein